MSSGDSSRGSGAYVLDSDAVMAYTQAEPGGPRVRDLVRCAQRGEVALHISVVNVTEVFYLVWRRQSPLAARRAVDGLPQLAILVHEAALDDCLAAGALKAQYPVSLGDAFAAALAIRLDATLLTGDPEFKRLKDVVRIEWLPRR